MESSRSEYPQEMMGNSEGKEASSSSTSQTSMQQMAIGKAGFMASISSQSDTGRANVITIQWNKTSWEGLQKQWAVTDNRLAVRM